MIQAAQPKLIQDNPVAPSFREWQKYRGWKLRILEELEHSGGMTTREISGRMGEKSHAVSNRLVEMQREDLVERIERWGWRITRDGIFLLTLNYTTTIPQQHHNNTTTTPQRESEEIPPSCFSAPTCHIKRICEDKSYNMKNMTLCQHCVWNRPALWIIPKVPVENMQMVS